MRTPIYLAIALLALTLAACDTANLTSEAGLEVTARPQTGFTTLHIDAASGHVTHGRPERVEVCRYDAEADTYKLITVGAPALVAHLRKGGGVPGGAVPDQEGYVFDEACQPMPMGPYTCTTETGVDDYGTNTLTVENRVIDPAFLPVDGFHAQGTGLVFLGLDFGYIIDDGAVVGGWGKAYQGDPSIPATLLVRISGPNIPAPGFVCGPYEFGAPPA
jgi:hypothetical protein